MGFLATGLMAAAGGGGGGALSAGEGFSLFGTMFEAGGAVLGGLEERRMARYGARGEEMAALGAQRVGALEMGRARAKGRRTISAQRAAYTAAGVTLEGSPMEIMQSTAGEAETDAQIARYNMDLQVQEHMQRRQLLRRRGRMGFTGGILRAGKSILFGTADIMGHRGRMQRYQG
ncbi:hypothetical protein LCGC14_0916720 [marine sediment metagenome]|uniref:Uncharacterized protein n=1 Tax=marine sediment metagenome TaxID=412755 RepID=A0A0F9RYU1_9ZZZZ